MIRQTFKKFRYLNELLTSTGSEEAGFRRTAEADLHDKWSSKPVDPAVEASPLSPS